MYSLQPYNLRISTFIDIKIAKVAKDTRLWKRRLLMTISILSIVYNWRYRVLKIKYFLLGKLEWMHGDGLC
jgi:hypothetical protein